MRSTPDATTIDVSLDASVKPPISEIDEVLKNNKVIYWCYWFLYGMANMSNLFHTVFQINTSNQGIENCIKAVKSDASIPGWLSNSIGISTSIMSTALYLLIFSAHKEAFKSTLKYANSKSTKEKMVQSYHDFLDSPAHSFLQITGRCTNISILLISNVTGSMPSIIDISDKILDLPAPLNGLIIAAILYLGEKYYEKYMDDAYYNGLKIWLDKSLPCLLNEVRKKNFSIPFQIMLQAGSSIGLRAFFFYYLAEAASKALGFWFPPPAVAVLIVFHSLCALYPSIYHRYMDAKIKNNKLSPEVFQTNRIQVLNELGCAYLFKKEPTILLPILFRPVTGGWLGWQAGELISDNIIVSIVSTIFIATLLSFLLFKAESERVMQELIDIKNNPIGKTNRTVCESVSDKCASILNFADCFSTSASLMGSGARLLGYASIFVPLWAIEKGLSMLHFNEKPVCETTREVVVPKKCRSSVSYSSLGFFAPPKASVMSDDIVKLDLKNQLHNEKMTVSSSPN